MAGATSARNKIDTPHPGHGKVCTLPPAARKGAFKGCATLLIPRPPDIEAIMRRVPKGNVVTTGAIRAELARRANADAACPLVTGIFVRLIGDAAEEDRAIGKARVTPWWRTIRDDGKLNDKFPGGIAAQAKHLRAEGVEVVKSVRGSALKVADLEARAWAVK